MARLRQDVVGLRLGIPDRSRKQWRNHRSTTDYHSVENRGFPEILGSPVCRFRIHPTPGPDRSTLLAKRFARTLLLAGHGDREIERPGQLPTDPITWFLLTVFD